MYLTIREYRVPAGQVEEVARRVDDDWLDRIRVLPGFLSYQVVRTGHEQLVSLAAFIDEAHALTRDAWGAFLKTLEEPPEHVVFVLATTEALGA